MKNNSKISGLLLILSILLPVALQGQTNTYKILKDLGTRDDYAHDAEIQTDGKLFIAGYAGNPCLLRYDTTGALDHTFGNQGVLRAFWTCGSSDSQQDIIIQPDGKIVMGTNYFNGEDQDFIVARYNPDGSPDGTFGSEGAVITPIGEYNDRCYAVGIQSDGKIIAAGGKNNSPQSDYNYDFALVRYNTDGSIDQSFGDNGFTTTTIGLVDNMIHSLAIQEDDKIIVAGMAYDHVPEYQFHFSDFAIARYSPNGELDGSFGNSGIVRLTLSETYDFARSVILQPDGKVLVAGTAQFNESDYKIALIRLNPDGSLDNSFGSNGLFTNNLDGFINDIALDPNNRIILAGEVITTGRYKFVVLRLHPDGSLDSSFGSNGYITSSFGDGDSYGDAVAVGDDGEIIVAGTFNRQSPEYFDFAILRLFSYLSWLPPPGLISPKDGVVGQSTDPTMVWQAVPGASTYNIQVSSSVNFDADLIECTGLPSPRFSVVGLNPFTEYFWRASGTGLTGTGSWSETWRFITGDYTMALDETATRLQLYPLPASTYLKLKGAGNEFLSIGLFSIEGKLVRRIEGEGIEEIDVSPLQSGIYLIRITGADFTYARKISIR